MRPQPQRVRGRGRFSTVVWVLHGAIRLSGSLFEMPQGFERFGRRGVFPKTPIVTASSPERMNSSNVVAAAWRDEAVALAIDAVLGELPEMDAETVMAAAKRCRVEVPVTGGLPLLRHRIRQRVLGIALLKRP